MVTGHPAVRLFYVDDSGATDTGWVVYSWIECAITGWRAGLRSWLDLRKRLYVEHGIPPAYELHATKFVNGRGRPSTDPEWNLHKQNRRDVMGEALATIAACPELRLGTVCRRATGRRGWSYQRQREEVYAQLVARLDTRLGGAGELGLLFMDGDGTDTAYYDAHRDLKLATRNIIEDPLFQAAHRSQWVQMADLVAYAAYQSLLRHPGKEFAWGWYDQYLQAIDVNGGPVDVSSPTKS